MADTKISALTALAAGDVSTLDNLVIVDTDAGVSKRITVGALLTFILTNCTPQLEVRSSAPGAPTTGDVVVADRTNWDPAAIGSGGPYVVWYNGTAWVRINEQ